MYCNRSIFFLLTRSLLVSPPKMFSFWIIISAIWIYIQDTYTNPYDLLDLFRFSRWFLFSFGDVGRNVKLLIARKLCLCFRELYLITTICSPGPICCLQTFHWNSLCRACRDRIGISELLLLLLNVGMAFSWTWGHIMKGNWASCTLN